ncbi:hypothetical protein [Wolbachia endosymbiont of Wuchereria bancrofti]|uniref:hypothetical protein n=1 Tax=Wolbachia endosymbiont of Wuchereria bancrofti TaxID=96496 RepID=UPI001FE653A6|nr:hypothetical protein [Wolbachia endosymbiont of Wuchereria bancrofti]
MYVTYHNFIAEGLAASYPCFCIYQIVVHYIVRGNTTTGNKYQKRIDFFNTNMASSMIDDVTEVMNNLYKKSGNDERKNI